MGGSVPATYRGQKRTPTVQAHLDWTTLLDRSEQNFSIFSNPQRSIIAFSAKGPSAQTGSPAALAK